MDGDNGTNGAHGVESTEVSVLSFVYNHKTHMVAVGGQPMPICLAQMIAGEGMRVLEEMRKIAAIQELRKQAHDQQATQAVLDRLSGKR